VRSAAPTTGSQCLQHRLHLLIDICDLFPLPGKLTQMLQKAEDTFERMRSTSSALESLFDFKTGRLKAGTKAKSRVPLQAEGTPWAPISYQDEPTAPPSFNHFPGWTNAPRHQLSLSQGEQMHSGIHKSSAGWYTACRQRRTPSQYDGIHSGNNTFPR
jgi:hypothetical protein